MQKSDLSRQIYAAAMSDLIHIILDYNEKGSRILGEEEMEYADSL